MKTILNIRGRLYNALPILTLIALVSACANFSSINRSQYLPKDKPHVISIDAKQRVILSNPGKAVAKQGEAARNSYVVRFCAEPTPDVFTALASSLGAKASLSQSASMDVAAELVTTISENAATIERTQTVNILREAMYRNCERYLSGAINEDEFIVQAARDQQLIIQVLAIEQITGVAKAQSTALTTVAKAAVGGVSDVSLTAILDAKKDVDAKRASSTQLLTEVEKLPPSGPCGDTQVDEVSPPDGVTEDQAKAKNAKCAEVAGAARLVEKAEKYYAFVQDTVAKQGSVNSENQGKLASAVLTASESSEKIAQKVVEIVKQYQAFDEIGMSCVVKLRNDKLSDDKNDFCKDLLKQMADTRSAQLGAEEERLKIEQKRLSEMRINSLFTAMDNTTQNAAKVIWEKLRRANRTYLEKLIEKTGVPKNNARREELKDVKDFETLLNVFRKLPMNEQKKLSETASQP
jgi:hypothetical protein